MLLAEVKRQVEIIVQLAILAMDEGPHGLPGVAAHGKVGAKQRAVAQCRHRCHGICREIHDRQGCPKEGRTIDETSSTGEGGAFGVFIEGFNNIFDPRSGWNAVCVQAQDELSPGVVVTFGAGCWYARIGAFDDGGASSTCDQH